MMFKKLHCCGGYYSDKGKVTMTEASFLMETSTGDWTADGDNSTMDVFFSCLMIKIAMLGALVQCQMD